MELARLGLGLLVAILLPPSLTGLQRRRLIGVGFTLTYSAYSIFPVVSGKLAWLLWFGVILFAATMRTVGLVYRRQDNSGAKRRRRSVAEITRKWCTRALEWSRAYKEVALQLATTVVILLTALIVNEGAKLPEVLAQALQDNRFAIVASGFALAVFIGNEAVAHAVQPYVRNLSEHGEDISKLAPNGKYLGWLERAIIFTFIAGGQTTAAALAITVKSLARLPESQRHQVGFVEYYLVGTLSSVAVALTCAVLVRVSLGLNPV